MARFDPDRLRDVSRELAGEHGVEKTPAEWDAVFRGMIASYRKAAADAGRLDIAVGWSDAQIWDRIQHLSATVEGSGT